MTIRSLSEVRSRLEEIVRQNTSADISPLDMYDCYERVAFVMLDSEFEYYPDGLLEDYLRTFLQLKALELLNGPPPEY
jgi:hypothetical protein